MSLARPFRRLPFLPTPRLRTPPSAFPLRHASSSSSSSTSTIPSPGPNMFEPPKFTPPPLSARLKPLIPFLIWWSVVTSLAVHVMQARKRQEEALDRCKAQASVLEGLIERAKTGKKDLDDGVVWRELQMVGLRERREIAAEEGKGKEDVGYVGWWEALLGKRRVDKAQVVEEMAQEGGLDLTAVAAKEKAQEEEDKSLEEWMEVVREASMDRPKSSSANTQQPQRQGSTRRAPSSSAYIT